MPIYDTDDPQQAFQRLRATGRATLPRDPVQARLDAQRLTQRASSGSLAEDVTRFVQGPSVGRLQAMSNYRRGMNKGMLADGTEEQIREIRNMRTGAVGDPAGGRTLSDVSLAWPKRRDPLRDFKEQSWYWLDNQDWNESLKRIREWCNTPEAPIWMADGTFKPIGEVNVGEEVMGWVWKQGPGGAWRKHFQPTTVVATNRRETPMVVEVEMQSGRTLRCTPDHKWANYYHSPAMSSPEGKRPGWTREYRPAVPKMSMHFHAEPVETPTEPKLISAAGYLGGIIDGEGTVDQGAVSISQSPVRNPEVCARIEEALNILGLSYNVTEREQDLGESHHGGRMLKWTILGGRRGLAALRAYSSSAKVEKAWEFAMTRRAYGQKDTVVSVTEIGPGEVVSMQTTTGNYVAWGYGSSNCRLVYMTHPLVPSLIDIYARFPLLDIEFKHKDQKLADWYNDLFLNELHYQEFLFDLNREYWTVGEAFPLGSWHEGIGAWDDDELLNPDDVVVARNKALRRFEYHVKIPETIRRLVDTREPREEYETLLRDFPYVITWVQQNQELPVSDVLLKQLKFKTSPWAEHGTPLLMRAFTTLMHEQSLSAAQQGVADRLYSPLILVNVGIEDMHDGEGPLIPEPEEVAAVRDDVALALMADFRLIAYHHGLTIQSVFGREVMPRLDTDFDRVDRTLMQIFGIGQELLSGGKSNVPYASGALNRELLTQMLQTSQVGIKRFLRERMEVVAEAQGHYEYDKKGSSRIPVMGESLMVNPETGEEYIEERPVLAIPEVSFKSMNLRDETTERQFYMGLKQAGLPISDATLMVNVAIDFEDELEKATQEKLEKTRAQLEYKRQLFLMIYNSMQQGPQFALPVPAEFAEEFDQWLAGVAQVSAPGAISDISEPAPTPDVAPTAPGFLPLPQPEVSSGGEGGGDRPPESDEQRKNAPRESGLARRIANAFRGEPIEEKHEEPDPSLIDEPLLPTEVEGARRYSEFSETSMKIGGAHSKRIYRVMDVPKGTQVVGEDEVNFTKSEDIFKTIASLDDLDGRLTGEQGDDDEEGVPPEPTEGPDGGGETVDPAGEVPGT